MKHSAAPQAPLEKENVVAQALQRHDKAEQLVGFPEGLPRNQSITPPERGNEYRAQATWRHKRQKPLETCKSLTKMENCAEGAGDF
eukprot:gene15292-biopygen6659